MEGDLQRQEGAIVSFEALLCLYTSGHTANLQCKLFLGRKQTFYLLFGHTFRQGSRSLHAVDAAW